MPMKSYTIDDDCVAILDKVGNRSEYICHLIRDRHREWHEALEPFLRRSVRTNEMMAMLDVMNGYWHNPSSPASSEVALNLHDAQVLHDIAGKWSIAPKRWEYLTALFAEDKTNRWGNALLVVSREFWARNAECERVIQRLDELSER